MDRTTELESRKICRICLTQDENVNFTDIFDSSNLPMELLSIGSVEVFESDGMPRKVCECCKTILGNAYKFKQICKRSDTLLKMYPMTGNVPPKIEIPQEMLPLRKSEAAIEAPKRVETKTVGVGCAQRKMKTVSVQTDPHIATMAMIIDDEDEEEYESVPIIAPPAQFSTLPKKPILLPIKEEQVRVTSVKILNKARTDTPAKQFRRPSQAKIERIEFVKPKILNQLQGQLKKEETFFESTSDGNMQIITYNEDNEEEYLDENEYEARIRDESMDKSDNTIVYTCNMCERSFPLLQQLEIHKQNHTRERNHPCECCEKSFFSKYDLAKHVLTHTKQKDYTCIICSKSFSRSTLLYRHEKIHNDADIARYNCAECDRVYLNPADYEKHTLTHKKPRPFQCQSCDKAFAFKQGLERHEVIHDNDSQPHPCQYCALRFPSAARLQRHLSSDHAGTRPFPCSKCSKRFMLSHHLYRHIRTSHATHEEVVSYQCQECEEVFLDREEFFQHCQVHADFTLSCPLCKITFESNKEAADHIALHSDSDMYFCDYCNSVFMTQEDVDRHTAEQHSEELCTIGEEFEMVEVPKKRQGEAQSEPASKKAKEDSITYDLKEIDSSQYEYLDEEQIISDGAAFVEYEEIESEYVQESKPAHPKRTTRASGAGKKTISPAQPKPLPMKPKVIKMSQARIEQLKKEGKIEMKDGNLMMRKAAN